MKFLSPGAFHPALQENRSYPAAQAEQLKEPERVLHFGKRPQQDRQTVWRRPRQQPATQPNHHLGWLAQQNGGALGRRA